MLFLIDKLSGALVSLPLAVVLLYFYDRERLRERWLWVVLLVLYLNAMYILVGVPEYVYITWDPDLNWIPLQNFVHSNVIGMVLNVVMFVPLGFLLPACFSRYRKWHRTLIAGFLTSLTVECIQLFTFRVTDVDDLLMNTLGAVIGFVLAKLLLRFHDTIRSHKKDMVSQILILEIVFIRYPLMDLLLSVFHIA